MPIGNSPFFKGLFGKKVAFYQLYPLISQVFVCLFVSALKNGSFHNEPFNDDNIKCVNHGIRKGRESECLKEIFIKT